MPDSEDGPTIVLMGKSVRLQDVVEQMDQRSKWLDRQYREIQRDAKVTVERAKEVQKRLPAVASGR
jgi:ribosome biogenesis SPOUT family RNA methylase Rps3